MWNIFYSFDVVWFAFLSFYTRITFVWYSKYHHHILAVISNNLKSLPLAERESILIITYTSKGIKENTEKSWRKRCFCISICHLTTYFYSLFYPFIKDDLQYTIICLIWSYAIPAAINRLQTYHNIFSQFPQLISKFVLHLIGSCLHQSRNPKKNDWI